MDTLKCLIIDDEHMARKLTEENIKHVPFLQLVGTCKNAFEATQFLQKNEVDLMFLDIQMPGMLGTQLLKSLPTAPMVIFITAYSNFAVESYELEVVDYLVKPVPLERFVKSAHKAMNIYLKNKPLPTNDAPDQETGEIDFFFVNVEYSLVKISFAEITHIEGMKDYVKIYLQNIKKPVLTKSTLKNIEERLPSVGFMRIHKSYIVQLGKIESIRNREIRIGAAEIPVGEANWEELARMLNIGK